MDGFAKVKDGLHLDFKWHVQLIESYPDFCRLNLE